ncbi:uncharacterized protein LOC134827041 [Culicoides brevitarsis]|uniref:uncharacterized protein LOC134827041 n=1 Tax=Culicoides brevitarsis TaxID=469753 RepID=UPI00307B2C56
MKVAVVGAGIAGLACCKYCKEANISVDCFEQTNKIGGTWVYSEATGQDKHGLPIHSAMYKNLYTNLPKETMSFHDFPFDGFDRSYVTPKEVLEYLEKYVEKFGFRESIKFEHLVTKVEPIENGKWRVASQDLVKDEQKTGIYDAIFVCNGHHFTPNLPKILGIENFKGKIMHSHEYRVPEPFTGQKVLTIGAGPSGIDITKDLSSVAKSVGFSHHGDPLTTASYESVYSSNVMQLPDVAQILEDGKVHFYNGEVYEFDTIIYCTGYNYSYPFLSPECQIKVEDNHVTELYKHVINLNHPTMYFIGIPFSTLIVPLFDLQVRFCLKFLTKAVELPSTEKMRQDLNEDIYQRQLRGYKKRKMHQLGKDFMQSYMNELATMANIEPVKPVIFDIYFRRQLLMRIDLRNYRNFNYKILDDFNFEETRQEVL